MIAGKLGLTSKEARQLIWQLADRGAGTVGWYAFVGDDPTPVCWLPFGEELPLPLECSDGRLIGEAERESITYEVALDAAGPVNIER